MQVSTFEQTKNKATEISVLLSKLPKEKQEYVNGYVQGIADTIAEREQQITA